MPMPAAHSSAGKPASELQSRAGGSGRSPGVSEQLGWSPSALRVFLNGAPCPAPSRAGSSTAASRVTQFTCLGRIQDRRGQSLSSGF